MRTQRRLKSYEELIAHRYGIGDGVGRKGPATIEELYASYYGGAPEKPAAPATSTVQWVAVSSDTPTQVTRPRARSRAQSTDEAIAPAAPPPMRTPNGGVVTPAPQPADAPPSEEDRAREEAKLDLFAATVPDQPTTTDTAIAPVAPAPAPPPPTSQAKSRTDNDAMFMADMHAILSGQKSFNESSRTVEARSAFPPPPEAHDDAPAPPRGQPAPQAPPPGGGHEIFERIAQSMEYAGAYDLGSVSLDNRFAQFDRERDGKAAPRDVAPAPFPAAPVPPPVAPPPVDTFREDMRDMLARPQPVAPPAPPPPPEPMAAPVPPPMPTPPPAPGADVFFPDPATLRIGSLTPPAPAVAQSLPDGMLARPFYGSGEHVQAGGTLYQKQLEVGPPPGLLLSYGDIIAMADLYESVDSMMQQPLPKLQHAKDLLDIDLAHALGQRAKGPSEKDWEDATAGNTHAYLELAEENFGHFAPTLVFTNKVYSTRVSSPFNHKERWEAHHKRAMAAARTPEALPWRNATPKNWPVTINAFGDHFLTDAFAGGHLFNKAEAMSLFFSNFYANGKPTAATETFLNRVAHVAWTHELPGIFSKLETADGVLFGIGHPNIDTPDMFARVLVGIAQQRPNMVAGLAVKVIHDKYNSEGIQVRNGMGEGWLLKGDSHLETTTLQKMQAAVAQSAADITDPEIQKPGFDPAAFCARVWRHVPQLTPESLTEVATTMTTLFKPDSPQLTSAAAKIINDPETARMIAQKLVDLGKLRPA